MTGGHEQIAVGDRNDVPVMRRAVRVPLWARDHERAREGVVGDPVDADPAVAARVAAAREALVAPDDVPAVPRERRGVPVIDARRVDVHRGGRSRVGRIGDVPDLALGLAGRSRLVDRQVDGDVMAADHGAVELARERWSREHARRLRGIERHLDDGDLGVRWRAARTLRPQRGRDVEQHAVVAAGAGEGAEILADVRAVLVGVVERVLRSPARPE